MKKKTIFWVSLTAVVTLGFWLPPAHPVKKQPARIQSVNSFRAFPEFPPAPPSAPAKI